MSSIINIFDKKTGKYIEIPTLRGPIGQTGISITDIKFDHSEGYVDYYKIYLSDGNFREFAGDTAGFTGAELANVLNEAAIIAAREKNEAITKKQLKLKQ